MKRIAVISSGSTLFLDADILEEGITEPLLGRLTYFTYREGGKTKLVIGQVTSVYMTNPWHENTMLKPIIKRRGMIPNLSGTTDLKMMTIKPLSVYEVSVNGEGDGLYPDVNAVYRAVVGGAPLKRSNMFTPPPSGTFVYLLDRALSVAITSAMYRDYNLVYLGYVYGSDTPIAFNLSPFAARSGSYRGLGEARMIGIFGLNGSGKSWLAAYLIIGYAKNPDMGILVLDPQGELSANFPTSMSKMPFHEMLKYACHRTVFAVPTKDLRIDPRDIYTVSLFLGMFVTRNLMLGRNERKLKYITLVLGRKINAGIKWLNPAAVYAEVTRAIYDNNIEMAAKELGMSVDEARNVNNIVKKIFGRFIDHFVRQVVDEVYHDSKKRTEITQQLNSMKDDPAALGLFSSFLRLFDTRSGVTMDEIIYKVLEQKAVVLLDLSGKYDDSLNWIDSKEFAAVYIRLITNKLRRRAEELFKGGELLDVLIAIDEAHNFVGKAAEDEEEMTELKKQIETNVRETRKYGIGWLFITQSTVNFSTDIYRQLHDIFFLYGLGVGADEDHMKERVPDEYVEIYQGMPNPKVTEEYWFMHTGSLTTLSAVTSATFVKIASPDEFLKMNFDMTLEDLKEKENVERAALEW